MAPHRKCSLCGKTEPDIDFGAGTSWCKPCKKEKSRQRRKDPEVVLKDRRSSREYQAKRRLDPVLAEADREYRKQWEITNSTRRRAQAKKWAQENQERRRAAVNRWAKAHPEHVRALDKRKKALKRASIAAGELVFSQVVFERDGFNCYICGEPTHPNGPLRLTPTLDHVVPLSKGGAHTMGNIRCAHYHCNASKGAR